MTEDAKILPPASPEAQRSQRSASRRNDIFVSGTVEILFRIHIDASRGVASTLYPAGVPVPRRDAGDRIWPSPHIRSELNLCALCASVVDENQFRALIE